MNITDFYALYLQANKVTIDSRKIEKNDMCFAFSGDNFNAATLAETAIDNGALAVIVEDENFENTAKNIFYVKSTLEFLQDLAKHHRAQLSIPIIALTAGTLKEERELCFSSGMSDYISKPVVKDTVKEVILKWRNTQKK